MMAWGRWLECFVSIIIIEPRHDKTNKMVVRPAKTHINLGIRWFCHVVAQFVLVFLPSTDSCMAVISYW